MRLGDVSSTIFLLHFLLTIRILKAIFQEQRKLARRFSLSSETSPRDSKPVKRLRFLYVEAMEVALYCSPRAESELAPLQTATVVLVGFADEDQAFLRKLFECSACPMAANCQWVVRSEADVAAALTVLRQQRIPVVLCDQDLMPQAWREILAELTRLHQPPSLIVSSRLADDYLWAEALNLGAYDVLARPFDRAEVLRSVNLAGMHWRNQFPPLAAAAGSMA
jgi:CheY-like chemotaxis protein